MPCNCDHMHPHEREIELSRIACLLDEVLIGEKIDPRCWEGYHPAVYSQFLSKNTADNMIATLCHHLKTHDVSQYSLECQMWWRDHQKIDKEREEAEALQAEVKQRGTAKR